MKNLFFILLCIFFLKTIYCFPKPLKDSIGEYFPKSNNGALYPEWAHHHWVWLSSGDSTQTKVLSFVQGFLDRGIPVGAVNIDSAWSTGINNFVWDKNKFPNATGLISHFHSLGIKVICWVTSMVNTDSPNYQEGYTKGYYLNDGLTAKWWHGWGSFIDYTNPDAVNWWHSQMDLVLNIGLDGWKCDGTDPILFEWGGIAHGYGGWLTERDYADYYYSDFFFYSQKKNPEALIMSRPVDSYGEIYIDFSPKDVMFSGWVGDQDPTFDGLQNALRNMFHSAWNGYLNFGSDTGGYRSGTRTKNLFIRWSQVSAFCPLFENGGDGPHGPWEFDNETVAIYSKYVNIHMELNPFFLSAAAEAYPKGISVMNPIADETIFTPSSWEYVLGSDILVAPIVEDTTQLTVHFPEGNTWVDWWNGTSYSGGSEQTFQIPLNYSAVYKRKGSIIPLKVTRDDSLYGDSSSSDALTLLITLADGKEEKNVYEWKNTGASIEYSYSSVSSQFELFVTAYHSPIVLVLEGINTLNMNTNFIEQIPIFGRKLPQIEKEGKCYSSTSAFNLESNSVHGSWCKISEKNQIIVRLDETSRGIHLKGTLQLL